ncbi:MAG TPA: hypothetical protein VJ654_01045 [Noviherbaspirillum sp.]|nr:hypothetical protein [Noviherbaspirillum sp.]
MLVGTGKEKAAQEPLWKRDRASGRLLTSYLPVGGGAELVPPVELAEPLLPEADEPEEAAGDFLALAFFFVFLAFGFASVVVSVPPAAEGASAELPDEPEAPEVPGVL